MISATTFGSSFCQMIIAVLQLRCPDQNVRMIFIRDIISLLFLWVQVANDAEMFAHPLAGRPSDASGDGRWHCPFRTPRAIMVWVTWPVGAFSLPSQDV